MFIKSKRYLYISLFVSGLIISLYSLVMLGSNTYFFGDLKDPATISLFKYVVSVLASGFNCTYAKYCICRCFNNAWRTFVN